jgi:hypothetical protein
MTFGAQRDPAALLERLIAGLAELGAWSIVAPQLPADLVDGLCVFAGKTAVDNMPASEAGLALAACGLVQALAGPASH